MNKNNFTDLPNKICETFPELTFKTNFNRRTHYMFHLKRIKKEQNCFIGFSDNYIKTERANTNLNREPETYKLKFEKMILGDQANQRSINESTII